MRHTERSIPAAVEAPPGAEAESAAGAVRAMFAAYAAKDLPRWIGSWSDEGFAATFGVAKSEAALVPPSWGNVRSFRESEVLLRDISEQRIDGDAATLQVETSEAGVVTWHRLDLVTEGGRWRVVGRTVVVGPPSGLPPVTVVLRDGAIDVDPASSDDHLDLEVANRGSVPHELVLLRDRGGVDETVGRLVPLAPGSTSRLVARALPEGTYSIVCNLLDDQGRPHSSVGMRATIEVS